MSMITTEGKWRESLPNGVWIDFLSEEVIQIGIGKGRTAITLDIESTMALLKILKEYQSNFEVK
jgi:hypothetical protein